MVRSLVPASAILALPFDFRIRICPVSLTAYPFEFAFAEGEAETTMHQAAAQTWAACECENAAEARLSKFGRPRNGESPQS
jgi:hypothetical protein